MVRKKHTNTNTNNANTNDSFHDATIMTKSL